jgi:hypothetical protein
MSESTDVEQIANKTFPLRLYHRTRPSVVVTNKEEKTQLISQGFTTRYLHEEYPVMVYHKTKKVKEHGHTLVPASKIVKNADEEEKLGSNWSREHPGVTYIDNTGFEDIGEKHVKFLQSKGFRVGSIEDAQVYFSQLNDDMQEEFLQQVEDWDESSLPVKSEVPKMKTKKKSKEE